MSPLATFIRYELKRVMSNISRAHPDADDLAVRLTIIDQLKDLKLAEVQPEDERERKTG